MTMMPPEARLEPSQFGKWKTQRWSVSNKPPIQRPPPQKRYPNAQTFCEISTPKGWTILWDPIRIKSGSGFTSKRALWSTSTKSLGLWNFDGCWRWHWCHLEMESWVEFFGCQKTWSPPVCIVAQECVVWLTTPQVNRIHPNMSVYLNVFDISTWVIQLNVGVPVLPVEVTPFASILRSVQLRAKQRDSLLSRKSSGRRQRWNEAKVPKSA